MVTVFTEDSVPPVVQALMKDLEQFGKTYWELIKPLDEVDESARESLWHPPGSGSFQDVFEMCSEQDKEQYLGFLRACKDRRGNGLDWEEFWNGLLRDCYQEYWKRYRIPDGVVRV